MNNLISESVLLGVIEQFLRADILCGFMSLFLYNINCPGNLSPSLDENEHRHSYHRKECRRRTGYDRLIADRDFTIIIHADLDLDVVSLHIKKHVFPHTSYRGCAHPLSVFYDIWLDQPLPVVYMLIINSISDGVGIKSVHRYGYAEAVHDKRIICYGTIF